MKSYFCKIIFRVISLEIVVWKHFHIWKKIALYAKIELLIEFIYSVKYPNIFLIKMKLKLCSSKRGTPEFSKVFFGLDIWVPRGQGSRKTSY